MSTVGDVQYRAVSWYMFGDIMSIVGGVQYRGGYHLLLFEYRGETSWHRWRDIMSTVEGVQYSGGTQITEDFSPHGTQDIPHIYHDIPHAAQDIPHAAQDIPHGTHDIPTVLNTHYTGWGSLKSSK